MTALQHHSKLMVLPIHGGMTVTVMRNTFGRAITTADTRVNAASTTIASSFINTATATRPFQFPSATVVSWKIKFNAIFFVFNPHFKSHTLLI